MFRTHNQFLHVILSIWILSGLLLAAPQGQQSASKADLAAAKKLLAQIAKYDYGKSRAALTGLDDLLRRSRDDAKLISALEDEFDRFLQRDVSFAAKQYICEKLSLTGTRRSLPVLKQLLADEKTSEMALFALTRIPDEATVPVLLAALDSAGGKLSIAVMDALAWKKSATAVPALIKRAGSNEQDVAVAALSALGRIGGSRAAEYLLNRYNSSTDKLHSSVVYALLD